MGRASRCKTCLGEWHKDNYLRMVEADPEFRQKQSAKAVARYAEQTPDEKRQLMAQIRSRRKASPNSALGKNLRRALARRPTPNHVTVVELIRMWHTQNGLCAVSGLRMTWAEGNFTATSMSIDRIDCDKGYTKDNVRLVCYQVNTFRGRWSDDQMLAMARAIVGNMDAKKDGRAAS